MNKSKQYIKKQCSNTTRNEERERERARERLRFQYKRIQNQIDQSFFQTQEDTLTARGIGKSEMAGQVCVHTQSLRAQVGCFLARQSLSQVHEMQNTVHR